MTRTSVTRRLVSWIMILFGTLFVLASVGQGWAHLSGSPVPGGFTNAAIGLLLIGLGAWLLGRRARHRSESRTGANT